MPNEMKMFTLADLFIEFKRGSSKYTKKYCMKNKGDIPVWSANNETPLAYKDFADFEDGAYLTISINGIAGKILILEAPFSVTADRVVGKPKDNVDISYIKYVAEPKLRSLAKGRRGENDKNEFSKLNPNIIGQAQIYMPIKSDGSFDVDRQKEIAQHYEMVERYRYLIKAKRQEIAEFSIVRFKEYKCKEIAIDKIFTSKRGSSEYTKKYANENHGSTPVYTGQIKTPSLFVNEKAEWRKELSYTTDGENAGTIEILEGKYIIGAHRATLSVKSEFVTCIDIDYCKYLLAKPMADAVKHGNVPSVVWKDLKCKNINIPINDDETFNIDAQKEIAHKYNEIARIKQSILDSLDNFLKYSIDFNVVTR